jgi:hypothetical protein
MTFTNLGDSGIWEDLDKDGETKNTMIIIGTDFKT